MHACSESKQWVKALQLISEMPKRVISFDNISVLAAMSACNIADQRILSLKLLNQMSRMKVAPDETTFVQQWVHMRRESL